jgi:hypothetical protein
MADVRQQIPDEVVKLASTAALATDLALVVTLSPNSPLPAGSNTIGTVNVASSAIPSTYSAAVNGLALAATATDIFAITGSATKTIRIIKLAITGIQTTAGQVAVLLLKRSTANRGGTFTAPTMVSYDTLNATATAGVSAYTANPTTVGTLVGAVYAARLFIPGAATASDAQGISLAFGDVAEQNMTLRGAAQSLALSLNGVTVVGGSANISIDWTES